MPLIVLTADRPPELRGIGAGQTIDQIKLYGSAVRWFCEVGTHDADDAGLLHFRSVACRAFWTAAGDPRPGPVHLNVPWRDPLGPEPRPGRRHGDLVARARGPRSERPLTTVAAGRRRRRRRALVEALAERIEASRRGADRRRAPCATRRRRRDRRARRGATGFPILAEPTSQLRLGRHDRSAGRLAPTSRSPRARPRCARARPHPALRRDADLQAAAPVAGGARRRPRSSSSTRRYGWNEPTRIAGAIVRADPARSARRARRGASTRGADAAGPTPGSVPPRRRDAAIDAELDALDGPPSPACTPRSGAAVPRRRPRLHRLEHADPRPGGVPARRRRGGRCSSPTGARTGSTA